MDRQILKAVEDFTTDFDDIEYWQEIPEYLYEALIKYNDSLQTPEEKSYTPLRHVTLPYKRRE